MPGLAPLALQSRFLLLTAHPRILDRVIKQAGDRFTGQLGSIAFTVLTAQQGFWRGSIALVMRIPLRPLLRLPAIGSSVGMGPSRRREGLQLSPRPVPWACGPNRGPRSSRGECSSSFRRMASRCPGGLLAGGTSAAAVPSCWHGGSALDIGREPLHPVGRAPRVERPWAGCRARGSRRPDRDL